MRAILCRAFGPPETLTDEQIPSPEPGPGEVIIAVKAAALNFLDLLIIEGKYQDRPPMPFSPGGEVAGVVGRVGEGVTDFVSGDRVMAFCLYGGFAEELRARASMTMHIPDDMDFEHAAAFVLTYGTAVHGLEERARLQAGETLLVLGAAGGAGLAAVEVGKALGARVIAAASSEAKLDLCREHGADATINYTVDDLRARIGELTGGKGVNVVFDPVGGPYALAALRGTAWHGRYVVIGFASGEVPKFPLNLPLVKECDVLGTVWGPFLEKEPHRRAGHFKRLREVYDTGLLRPHVSRTFPLGQVAEAMGVMASRGVLGKVVLTV